MNHRTAFFAALLAASLFSVTASAAEWPSLEDAPTVERTGANDIALLVGIEDYLLLPDVSGATRNVRAWETFLRDGLGIETVVTLTNTEAVREEVLAAATRVRDRAQEGGTVWFVFVGHGAPSPDGTDGLLVGADGQQTVNSLATRSVSQRELSELFAAGPQARTMMIVDACFSGRDSSGAALAKGAQPVVPVEIEAVPAGVTLMTAARSTEFAGALPGEDRPAFSYLLLGAIRGWADDGDGRVTASEAVRYARSELADVVGREQTPQLIGDPSATLSTGVSEAPPRQERVAIESPATDLHQRTFVPGHRPSSDVPITDDFGFFKLHLGLGGSDGFSRLGVLFMANPGIKLIRGHRADLRLGAWIGANTHRNPNAPSVGTVYGNDEFFGEQKVEAVHDSALAWFNLGAGPGTAFRWSTVGGGLDRTIYADTMIGLSSAVGGYCTQYDRDFISSCTDEEPRTTLALGAKLGTEFPILDIAGYFLYRPEYEDALVGITAGFSFDR